MGTASQPSEHPTAADAAPAGAETLAYDPGPAPAPEGNAMSLELNPTPRRVRAVRDGQSAPVTCAACGCRLEASGTADAAPWFHFGRLGGRDARGCRPSCVETAHDRSGQAILAA